MVKEIDDAIRGASPLFGTGDGQLRSPDSFGPGAGVQNEAATVRAADKDQFEELLSKTNATLGGGRPQSEIDDEVRHEGQHSDAARMLGATATIYGLRFFRVYGPQCPKEGEIRTEAFTTHNFAHSIPVLGKAAVLAYPLQPSVGDIADINGLGYPNIDVLGTEIQAHNKVNGLWIPVPLSCGSSTATTDSYLGFGAHEELFNDNPFTLHTRAN